VVLYISRSVLLRMGNVSDGSRRGKKNTFWFNNFFFRKSCRLWDNGEKYCRVGQATDGNMAHCMPDNLGYTHTLRTCNIYCFPTATMVARMRLNVMLCVHCLDTQRLEDWESREYRKMQWTWSGIYVSYNYTVFSKVCHWEIRKWIWFNEANYSETLLSYTWRFAHHRAKALCPARRYKTLELGLTRSRGC